MRAILRLDAYPPDVEGADEGGMFATMITQLRSWLEEHYPEWSPVLTTVVGFDDTEEEARRLLRQAWIVAREEEA